MLPGRLEATGGGVELHLVSGERVMLAGATPKLAWFGHDVVLGVRPEHIQPARLGEPVALEATIEALEPVGNEVFLHLRYAALTLTLRVPPQELPGIGESLPLAVQPDRLHVFNAISGECLTGH